MHTSCVCAVDNKISVLLINHADSVFCKKTKKNNGKQKTTTAKTLTFGMISFFLLLQAHVPHIHFFDLICEL